VCFVVPEDEKSQGTTSNTAPQEDKHSDHGYRVYGNDVLKARPTRWQARAHGSRGDMTPGVAENDPNYYPKLFQWLDQVGRK